MAAISLLLGVAAAGIDTAWARVTAVHATGWIRFRPVLWLLAILAALWGQDRHPVDRAGAGAARHRGASSNVNRGVPTGLRGALKRNLTHP